MSDSRHIQTVKLVSDQFRLLSGLSTIRDYVNLLMQRVSKTMDYIRKCCHLLNLGRNMTIDNKNNI